MKYIFAGAFASMLLLSVVAWRWQPHDQDDRIPLVWASDDNPMRHEQIELFNKLYPKYRLRLDPLQGTSPMEKVIVQCIAGVGPDLFDCYDGYQLSAYVRSGIALDCTDELAKRGVKAEDTWSALWPLVIHEGRTYGFPDNANAHGIWFNKKIFDEEGVPYPTNDWTWDDFIRIGQRLTQRNERGQISRYGMIGYWDWKLALFQWGGNVFNAEGTRSALDSPKAIAAAQFMQDLVHKDEVMPTLGQEMAMASAGGWGSGVIALFGAEKSVMAMGGRWWLCILRNESYANLDLGAVEVPAGPSRRIWGGGRSTLVNANGKNIEGALCFLEYMHSEHWNNLVNRQADALAPVKKYNYSEEFLHDPDHPEEDYNAVWRTALENAEPEEVSPFVNGRVVDRILIKQTEMMREKMKSAEEAMRDSAEKINEAIVETLEMDPVLRERYRVALENGAQTAWDSEEDAPEGFYP
jgi:multiple sugar transport system substrate-binding protein